jgi:uncharacterized protein DUF559
VHFWRLWQLVMHVHLRELAANQRDLVAAWQLRERGWSWAAIRWAADDWRRVHHGVYALTQAPLTRRQLWMAATLTAPGSILSHASAGALYEIRNFAGRFETITRPGNGGPRQARRLVISHSKTLEGDTTDVDGIPITTAERTIIDLVAHDDPARMLREALRLKLITPYSLAVSLQKHGDRRGTAKLKHLNDRYSGIPYSRCRSNAEARALEILHDAGAEPPLVNVRIHREEADLTWPGRRLIIEIDGRQFHQISAEDARKQGIWERAGYTVRRIGSDLVYASPRHLLALLDS